MKISDIMSESVEHIIGISSTPVLDLELIVAKILGRDRLYVITHMDCQVSNDEELGIRELVRQRIDGRPLQYITGHQEFMGLDFNVSEGVLIPRPDTEILVEKVIELAKGMDSPRILDIGCGSGAITVSIAKYVESSRICSIDISERAIDIATENAKKNGVYERIRFVRSDLFEKLEAEKYTFDIIVSNPPYIKKADIETLHTQVKDYEPKGALDGGEDGLDFYRVIVSDGKSYIVSGGYLAFEVGHDQALDVAQIMEDSNGFEEIRIFRDLAGIERVVIGRKI